MQTSSLQHAQSFHPVFKTRVVAPGFEECALHLHYVLPPLVFVDPYELDNRAESYSFRYAGPESLELPAAALPDEQAALLISVVGTPEEVEVPLHVRYPAADAVAAGPFKHTELPWPEAFYVCPPSMPSTDSVPPMPQDFDASFANASIFRLATPPDAARMEIIRTPVGDSAHVAQVELGTAVVVLVSFFYLARAVRRTVARMGRALPAVDSNSKED
ncbi:PIG-X [Mycena latifolia]|nr:PIG-X [Mycena latifolia]